MKRKAQLTRIRFTAGACHAVEHKIVSSHAKSSVVTTLNCIKTTSTGKLRRSLLAHGETKLSLHILSRWLRD